MDSFINLAKKGMEQLSESHEGQHGQQGDVNIQGGSQWNTSHHAQYQPEGAGHDFKIGSGQRVGPDVDADEAVREASNHAGESGGSDLFGQAMSFLNRNSQQHTQPVDEEHVLKAHDRAYNKGETSGMDASSIGSAAAMQIVKQFIGNGDKGGSGNSQTKLVSMAMGEAAKLFESSGSSGNKQDAVNSAGMTIMKLLVQSKFNGSGIIGGGSSSSNTSGLMSMVTKLL